MKGHSTLIELQKQRSGALEISGMLKSVSSMMWLEHRLGGWGDLGGGAG